MNESLSIQNDLQGEVNPTVFLDLLNGSSLNTSSGIENNSSSPPILVIGGDETVRRNSFHQEALPVIRESEVYGLVSAVSPAKEQIPLESWKEKQEPFLESASRTEKHFHQRRLGHLQGNSDFEEVPGYCIEGPKQILREVASETTSTSPTSDSDRVFTNPVEPGSLSPIYSEVDDEDEGLHCKPMKVASPGSHLSMNANKSPSDQCNELKSMQYLVNLPLKRQADPESLIMKILRYKRTAKDGISFERTYKVMDTDRKKKQLASSSVDGFNCKDPPG